MVEGAGSPAEINLRAGDYVNMGLAQHGGVPTVVVGDIDRGGVFAAFFGTVALLSAADQALVAGFVVNKFRGDLEPAASGPDRAAAADRPRGVRRPAVAARTSGSTPRTRSTSPGVAPRTRRRRLRVAVVRLPRITNFTDVDALGIEPGVDVVFASDPRALAGADLVVLPGTRATISDLDVAAVPRARPGDARARGGRQAGARHLRRLPDARAADHRPDGVEGDAGADVDGLGLLDVTTTFEPDKVLRLPVGTALGADAHGYEIHHGRITRHSGDGVPRRRPVGRGPRHDVARQPGGRRPPAGAPGGGVRGGRGVVRAVGR